MNLEFDIATQLFPNILTIITQLMATFIIFIFAKKFLFKEVRKYLENRKNFFENEKIIIEKTKKDTEINLINAKNEYLKTLKENESLKNKVDKELEEYRIKMIQETKKEAELIIENARITINQDKEKVKEDIKNIVVDLVIETSKKILPNQAEQFNENSILEIAKELEEND